MVLIDCLLLGSLCLSLYVSECERELFPMEEYALKGIYFSLKSARLCTKENFKTTDVNCLAAQKMSCELKIPFFLKKKR